MYIYEVLNTEACWLVLKTECVCKVNLKKSTFFSVMFLSEKLNETRILKLSVSRGVNVEYYTLGDKGQTVKGRDITVWVWKLSEWVGWVVYGRVTQLFAEGKAQHEREGWRESLTCLLISQQAWNPLPSPSSHNHPASVTLHADLLRPHLTPILSLSPTHKSAPCMIYIQHN